MPFLLTIPAASFRDRPCGERTKSGTLWPCCVILSGIESAAWRQKVEPVEIQVEGESWGTGRDDGHPERESLGPLWLGTLDVL